MSIEQIRRKYRNVPAKRGAIVRYPSSLNENPGPFVGRVVSTDGTYVRAVFPELGKRRFTFHVYSLDWQDAGGNWLPADVLKRQYDQAWDGWNARGGTTPPTPEQVAAYRLWIDLGAKVVKEYGPE